jgi:chemotaxis-related protein WspB
MLFLLFQLGDVRYALQATSVIEVVPLLELKRLPQAPAAVAGIINYRGKPVPAIDLSELTLGRPCAERLSTRIIIVNYTDLIGRGHLLGLIAENATDLLHKDPAEFSAPTGPVRSAPYLGSVFVDAKGPVQCLREEYLLSEPVRNLLFSQPSVLAS